MEKYTLEEVKSYLAEAVQLLDGVRIEQDRNNMKRYIVGLDRVETALYMLEHMDKEEEKHANDHDQQK